MPTIKTACPKEVMEGKWVLGRPGRPLAAACIHCAQQCRTRGKDWKRAEGRARTLHHAAAASECQRLGSRALAAHSACRSACPVQPFTAPRAPPRRRIASMPRRGALEACTPLCHQPASRPSWQRPPASRAQRTNRSAELAFPALRAAGGGKLTPAGKWQSLKSTQVQSGAGCTLQRRAVGVHTCWWYPGRGRDSVLFCGPQPCISASRFPRALPTHPSCSQRHGL